MFTVSRFCTKCKTLYWQNKRECRFTKQQGFDTRLPNHRFFRHLQAHIVLNSFVHEHGLNFTMNCVDATFVHLSASTRGERKELYMKQLVMI